MSLPDGAEYWWDVKGYNRSSSVRYLHLNGRPCGKQTGGGETECIGEVSCKHCKKTDEFKAQDAIQNPRCTRCGKPMVKRQNKTSRQYFLSCSGYPNCKQTKSIQ